MLKKVFFIMLLLMSACRSLEKITGEDLQITNIIAGNNFSRIEFEIKNRKNLRKIELYRNKEYDRNRFFKLKDINCNDGFTYVQQSNITELQYYFNLIYKDDIEIKTDIFNIKGENGLLKIDRNGPCELQIILPKGYEKEDKNYNVIYLLDGMDNFETEDLEDMMFDEIFDLHNDLVKDILIVGIEKPKERYRDFVPYKDFKNAGVENPGAEDYSKIIVEKIIPYIDKSYKTIKKTEGRTIMGISHGGLLAHYLFQSYPNIFKNCAAISPAFWVADFQELKNKKRNTGKLYIFTGTKEWENNGRLAVKAYEKADYKYGENIIYYEGNNEMHHQDSWRKIILDPIIYFQDGLDEKGKIKTEIEYIYGHSVDVKTYSANTQTIILNPVFISEKGIKYSLLNKASYESLDEDIARINSYGEMVFYKDKICRVGVKYKNIEEIIKVDPSKKIKDEMSLDLKINKLFFENRNGLLYLNWKINRWNPYLRVEVYGKLDSKDEYKFLSFKESYFEKMKLDLDEKDWGKMNLLIKFIGEDEKIAYSIESTIVRDKNIILEK